MDKTKRINNIWLALKYLRGRGSGLVNRSHYLTIAGILLGVTALICVSSVMNGFRADIRTRIVGTLSEMRIHKEDGSPFSGYEEVVAKLEKKGFKAAPVIRNELVLKRGSAIFSTLCFGIDPALHAKVSGALSPRTDASGAYLQGLLAGNVTDTTFANGGIALGATLANNLQVQLGDEVQLLSPMFDVPTAFGLLPRVRTLRVAAIFRADMPEYDQTYSYIPLDVARFFRGYADEVDYLEVKTPDFDKTALYSRQLRALLPGFAADDWSKFDTSLYGAIRFEKYMMFVIMLFMYIIASFNLTGSMLKSIAQKRRELGLLKAIGYRDNDLSNLFLYQSLILSTLGIALGVLLSTVFLVLQSRFGLISLDMGDAGPMPLPVKMMGMDYLMVVLVSYTITLVSVILPLRRLRQINPVALIRQTA